MKLNNEEMKVNILALAVRCALLATFSLPLTANADDADAYALTHPNNTVGFGALYSSQDSAKFGQYNGLNKEGAYGIGNFDIRGGDGYDADKNSALRWKLNGADLGTTARTLGGSISDQGKWKFGAGYDELRHNITDTYQTPLQGNPGQNEFYLPGNFGSINSATGLPGTRSLTPNQLSAFQNQPEYTERRNGKINGSYTISPQFNLQFDYNHLDQTGAKLIGTGSQAGITLPGKPSTTGRAEAINIIMNPTNYSTDTINGALNWTGDKGHLSVGYFGSLFYDNYNSLSWQNPIATGASGCTGSRCFVNNTMSTAPSNSLHQANLSGGYNFSPTTKLAGGFSYSYNAQNSNYAQTNILQPTGTFSNMMRPGGLPGSSLNGQVATTHGDLKLTNQSIKDLTLSAGFKYNQRDNYTNSDIYKYFNIAGGAYTAINTPYSNSKSQYEAAADYRLTKGQNLRLAFEREDIKRWCNQVVGGAQCIASPSSNEDKVSLGYRLKALENVNFNAGYSFAKRNANFDHTYMSNVGNYVTPTLTTLSGNGLNGGDFLGFIAYPYANRNQNMVKTGVNWQATQKLDMGLNGRYTYDSYDATLGVQSARSTGVNFDTTYSYMEKGSISAYWSWQNGTRSLSSGANNLSGPNPSQLVAPKNIFTNQLEDTGHAFGFLTRNGGLLNNKLEIIGDFSYSIDKSSYSTQVPYLATCGSPSVLSCGNVSPIKNGLFSLKLTGNYTVHKNGRVSLAYIYQQLSSNDYFYNGQQFGFTPSTLMPTGLQPQSYRANVVALSYNYNF